MKRYAGGEQVLGGYYWRLSQWEIVPMRAAKAALPGAPAERYLALPLPAVPLVVALMAAANVFFVPAIGFLMVFYALWARVTGKVPAAPKDVAKEPELPKG